MLCAPQAVPLEAALLAGDAKPQAHISDSQLQATEVSPRHLVNLPQICSDFVWVTGFRQESLKAATPEGLTLERAAPGVLSALILLLYDPPSCYANPDTTFTCHTCCFICELYKSGIV